MKIFNTRLFTLLPTFFLIALFSLHFLPPVYAQEKNAQQKQSRAPLIRKKIYDKLSRIQDLTQQKKYQQALKILQSIKKIRKLNSSESAQLWNFYAFIYFSQEQYSEAIKAYETLLEQPDLQLAIKTSTLYTLSQLYFLTENYAQALLRIKQWIALTDNPSPNAYALLGQAYYNLDDYKSSISAFKKAIVDRKKQGRQIDENWYLLLRANYFELKDYTSMVKVLTELTTVYPQPRYFLDLASAYSQLGNSRAQLGIMETLYESGQLNRAFQLKTLSNLFLVHDVPYKAAILLEKAIKSGVLKTDEKNLSLLSQSWIHAREYKKALEPLTQLAKISGKGEDWNRLGRVYVDLELWPQAVDALQQGISREKVKNIGTSYILLGMALYNLNELDKSRSAFNNAAIKSKNKRNLRAAEQWIKFLDTEIESKS